MPLLPNKNVNVKNLGLIDYKEAWDYQEELFKGSVDQKIANRKLPENEQLETSNYLLFCQHPHVYTLGKSGDETNLLLQEEGLKAKDAKYYKINRGGDITYHGPGQIVCYPILDLEHFFTDIHKYMRNMEEAVILTLADYGLDAGRIEGLTGVWLGHKPGLGQPRKISAMGVKSSRWITMHGLALNVNPDLTYFGNIVPCGITDKAVTSIEKELGRTLSLSEVENKLKNHLLSVFEMNEVEAS